MPQGKFTRDQQGRQMTAPRDPSGEPPLSRDRIAAAAVDLLNAQGMNGLTMRRLADRLGAGAMSLYWHVSGKEEVLDLALDAVLACPVPPGHPTPETAAPSDWTGEILDMLEDWRARMLRHPWSAGLLPRRALGPGILGRLEFLGKALSAAGVRDADLNVAIWSIWNYVMGATVTRASFTVPDATPDAAEQRLARVGADYPTIGQSRLLLDDDWDGTFRKGLGCLLEGLTQRKPS